MHNQKKNSQLYRNSNIFSKSALAFLLSATLATQAAHAFTPGGNNGGNTNPPVTCTSDCTVGPDPTVESMEAIRGPYEVSFIDIPGSVPGFGSGRIHYPANTAGKLGLIVVGPGYLYTDEQSSRWWGPRLSSHGFIVVNINFNAVTDQPDARANQYDKVIDYVIGLSEDPSSEIYQRVDTGKIGAAGWSMGGGGALKLAKMRDLKAIMPFAPWYSSASTFSTITTPSLIIACQGDIIAPVGQHASPFYNNIPETTPKQFAVFANGNHFCANKGSSHKKQLGKLGVAWFKRFMYNDTRYDQFLCDADVSAYPGVVQARDNCDQWN